MSKGNPIIKFRASADLAQLIDATVNRLKVSSRNNPPADRSDFVRRCVLEKLAHIDRSAGRVGNSKRARRRQQSAKGVPARTACPDSSA